MKILKQGKIDNKPKKFECSECGCVFEADDTEYSKWHAPMNETYFVAICPCCGESVFAED